MHNADHGALFYPSSCEEFTNIVHHIAAEGISMNFVPHETNITTVFNYFLYFCLNKLT